MRNHELEASDTVAKNIFTVKDIEKFNGGEIECFIDELTRIENSEAVFSDYCVQVFFDDQGLFDPCLFNEQTLEEDVLGSFASYRNKIMVITVNVRIILIFIRDIRYPSIYLTRKWFSASDSSIHGYDAQMVNYEGRPSCSEIAILCTWS